MKKIRIGTRGSELAMWQANHVADLLGRENVEIIVIKTQGDKIQNVSFDKMEGKGFFTKEIEEALLEERIDLAVHSLKDLPTENPEGLTIAAIPERGPWGDLLLIRPEAFDGSKNIPVKDGACIGTSSMRRRAQVLRARPDVTVEALRGNVNTRLRKLREKQYDAIVMAEAGQKRINLDVSDMKVAPLGVEYFLPAPAQGALGLQIRSHDRETFEAVAKLNDPGTERLATAERSFLEHFGGGCHVPIGAFAEETNGRITLTGMVADSDGAEMFRESAEGTMPEEVGAELASILKAKGAEELL